MKTSALPMVAPNQSSGMVPSFEKALAPHYSLPLKAQSISTLQVNVGKVCNQTCHHCHVDAGPHRTESMSKATIDQILDVLDRTPQIMTVDITGGAPEMNPHFEYLVEQCRVRNRKVIDRCNLTVFYVKGKAHLPQFLADHHVDIVASLPCYEADNVDQQRGKGVFNRSITALQTLNGLGYGTDGTGLMLDLVYNPLGPVLPPPQIELEQDFKGELGQRFGIRFNRLYTITNMPISRFWDELHEAGQLEHYYTLLLNHFNPMAINGLMCRSLLSVGWDGRLYDCDFNQMLDLPIQPESQAWIDRFNLTELKHRPIAVGPHCLGCTAGSGSSCGGALT
ncbi:arsenosugar biosynthesis radical SAM (seleno)protein ArsS [Candidatus Nitrospira allomarina]|uniref:Arsenosugar biosynthesis radical SAM protein ArsS n=1 Tax=Candidatus Nitrospira allomarina TaxID=3020900 RepID=A0AA96JTH7_9BACT|nr:arsenosugar biosynthesis radical SAM (seleno)protein ArsS [Candidatus Nitrospira allomarina]WNM59220.1 arsenosugar biosynthesis radical SAM protein ArsS [Candidatus Nitrospira allomarina]